MNKIKEKAREILDISKKVYQIEECNNPKAIFKSDKSFIIKDKAIVTYTDDVEFEEKSSSYYFETPTIEGVIIKSESSNYCVKASVQYTDANNESLWFAKIRIENSYSGDIQIMGKYGGSWEDQDYDDEDFIKKNNTELSFALDSMRTYLVNIYNELCNNSNSFDPQWIKKLKKYNK